MKIITKDTQQRIAKLRAGGATYAEVKEQLDVSNSTIQRYENGPRVVPEDRVVTVIPGGSLQEQVYQHLRKSKSQVSIEVLADKFDVAPKYITTALAALAAEGKNVDIAQGHVELVRQLQPNSPSLIDVKKFAGRTIRFGLTGDNHLGSKYYRADVLNALFDIWQEQGIDTVYQLGNMIDGDARFNKFDLIAHGMQDQVDYFVEHWPHREGITTRFITGDDHEGWYVQREGVDIGAVIEGFARRAGRTDLEYLGHIEHDIVLQAKNGSSVMRLIHAGGGSAYATSYSVQKIVECVPLDTEALTRTGWKTQDQLNIGDEILGFNTETGKCEWTTIDGFNQGRGEVVTYKNDQFKVRCTRNHKWVIDLEHRAGPNKNSKTPTQYRRETRELMTIDEIKNNWRRARLVQAAEAVEGPGMLELSHEDWIDRRGAVGRVLSMTSTERRGFVYGMLVGEGTLTDSGSLVFSQNPGEVNDAFKLACFLEGIATGTSRIVSKKINGDEKINARTTVLRKNRRMVNSLQEISSTVENVWCPTTGLGTWVMRQGDVITITGNSYQGGEKPSILLVGHYHKAEYGYPREVHVVQCGTTEDQTPFMRKLKIQAHVGGWTISFDVDNNGLIHRFTPQFHPFYDRAFYENADDNKQWNYKFDPRKTRKPTVQKLG